MSNLSLWNKVCETDPNFTKQVNQRGGYTSVSPQYQIREATEQFGAYGMGWGFKSIDFDYQFVQDSGLVIIEAIFFYELDGKRAEFPIKNAWPMKQGARVDPDFAKKAETNTLSKALSKLGFSADVFLGRFDDAEYVNMMDAKTRIESNDDEKIRAANDEFKSWFNKQVDAIGLCPNPRAVTLVTNKTELTMLDKLTILKATPERKQIMVNRLHKAADDAVNKLNQPKGE